MRCRPLRGHAEALDVAVDRGLVGCAFRFLPAVGADAERSPRVVEDRVGRMAGMTARLLDQDVHFRVAPGLALVLVLAVRAVALAEDDGVQLVAGVDLLLLIERLALNQIGPKHAADVPARAELHVDVIAFRRSSGEWSGHDDFSPFREWKVRLSP
jgi:hypothetical protein